MSYSASLDLQGAMNTALRNSATLQSLVGQRVYDRVPPSPTFPYVSFGVAQEIEDEVDCIDGTEVFIDIDVWSQAQGRVEASYIAGAIRKTLKDVELVLQDHTLCLLQFRDMRVLRDPDMVTTHIVMTYRALIEFS